MTGLPMTGRTVRFHNDTHRLPGIYSWHVRAPANLLSNLIDEFENKLSNYIDDEGIIFPMET